MAAQQGGDPYIQWLKSLGCLVYLPLSADGDLVDRISGLSLQLSGNGSMTWDNAQQMYKIHTPATQYQYVASLENGMTGSDFPSNSFTVATTFKKITNAGYPNITQLSPKSTDDNTIVSLPPSYNASSNVTIYPTYVLKLAKSESATERKFYQQGTLYTTLSPAPQVLPSNWVMASGGGLVIGMVRQAISPYTNKEYYLAEVYLFDGVLTLDQIRTIQGY